jgi:hypothetical protein
MELMPRPKTQGRDFLEKGRNAHEKINFRRFTTYYHPGADNVSTGEIGCGC